MRNRNYGQPKEKKMRNFMRTLFVVAAITAIFAISASTAQAAVYVDVSTASHLDCPAGYDTGTGAYSGINPGTGETWKSGDTFHLLFVTSTGGRNADSPDIGVYNQFVNTVAEGTGSAIAGYGVTWFVISSTPTVDARDNALISGPVYGLDGNMLATGYADMWDGSIAARIMFTEKKEAAVIGSNDFAAPYTGTKSDGTSRGTYSLGGSQRACTTGRTDYTNGKWIEEWTGASRNDSGRPYYALSEPASIIRRCTWGSDADGDWSTAGNWIPNAVPDGGDIADLNQLDITADRTVTIGATSRKVSELIFGDTSVSDHGWTIASTGGNLTLGAMARITVNDLGTAAATISASVDGTGGLAKDGVGTLVLTGANIYSGETALSAGALQIGNNLALQNSHLVLSGGTFAFSPGIGAPAFGGLTSSTDLTLASNFTSLTFNPGAGVIAAYSGNLSGGTAMSLTKTGPGTQVLSGANAYTGATTVNGGVLRLGNATALPGGIGATGGASELTINSGVVELADGDFHRNLGTSADQFQITGGVSGFSAYGGARTITVNNNAATELVWGSATFAPTTLVLNEMTADNTLTLSNKIDLNAASRIIAVNADTAVISGVIRTSTGTAALTKIGNGRLVLSGDNSYDGGTTLSAGTLSIGHNGALGTGDLAINGGTIEADGAAQSISNDVGWGGNFTFGGNQDLTISGTTTLGTTARTVTIANSGRTTLGAVTSYAADHTFTFDASSGDLEMAGAVTLTGGNRKFTININPTNPAGSLVISGAVQQDVAGRGLTKDGAGTLVLSGASNTYSGTTEIRKGALRVNQGAANLSGGNLKFTGSGVLETSGSFTRAIGTGNDQVQWSNEHGGFAAHGGALTVTLTPAGGSAGDQLTWGSRTTGFNGRDPVLGSVTADSAVTLTNSIDAGNLNRNIRLYDNPYSDTDRGVLAGDVTKLKQLNLYGGGTIVIAQGATISQDGGDDGADLLLQQGSTLIVNGTVNLADDLKFRNAGETLGGSGTINTCSIAGETTIIDMNSGRYLTPGDGGTGTLTIETGTGDEFQMGGSTYLWEVGQPGSTDILKVTGAGRLDINNITLNIFDDGGYVASESEQLPVFTYDAGVTTVEALGTITINPDDLDGTWTIGTLALTDGGSGTIYLTGLSGGTPDSLIGDADENGVVNAADYMALKRHMGTSTSATLAMGNFDTDQDVDYDDLQLLIGNFDAVSGGAPAVPEPATLFVLLAAGLPALLKRRQRRS